LWSALRGWNSTPPNTRLELPGAEGIEFQNTTGIIADRGTNDVSTWRA
jgi:hypothetical protein